MSQSELDAYRTVIGVIVVLAVRWTSNRLGPTVGALILGLPLTSPLYLLCVSPTSISSTLMLCSAVAAYPGIHAWKLTVSRCRFAPASLVAGALSFVAATLMLQIALRYDNWAFLLCCFTCITVGFVKFPNADLPQDAAEMTYVKRASPVMGYGIPVVCWLFVMSAKSWLPCGELLGGFPLITASALAGEWFSQGRAGALRIADTFPYGQTSTVAFLATFGLTLPLLDLTTSAVTAYASAAVVTSVVAKRRSRSIGLGRHPKQSHESGHSVPAC